MDLWKLLVEIILWRNKPFFVQFYLIRDSDIFAQSFSMYNGDVIINNFVHLALLLSRYGTIDIFIRILRELNM